MDYIPNGSGAACDAIRSLMPSRSMEPPESFNSVTAADCDFRRTGPNDEQDQSSSLLIMPGRFPATSLLASVVIPTRQKVLDVKSRLMTCAYILERISSRSPR